MYKLHCLLNEGATSELTVVEVDVEAVLGEQFLMCALLDDGAVIGVSVSKGEKCTLSPKNRGTALYNEGEREDRRDMTENGYCATSVPQRVSQLRLTHFPARNLSPHNQENFPQKPPGATGSSLMTWGPDIFTPQNRLSLNFRAKLKQNGQGLDGVTTQIQHVHTIDV
jgi:hypothetical protein